MIRRLLRRLFPFFRKKAKKRSHEQLYSKKVALPYCLTALLLFGLQGFMATGGALEVVFPDLPLPVNFPAGRSFHLNLSLFWPLLGTTGAAYYFLVESLHTELYSRKIAIVQFWLTFFTGLAILGTLLAGHSEGREYLEALNPLKGGLLAALFLFFVNTFLTIRRSKKGFSNPAAMIIFTGVALTIIFYAPALFFVSHPTLDDLIRFYVIHMWEEATLELLLAAIIFGLIAGITGSSDPRSEKLLLVETGLVAATGFIAIGHHYYWIGTPSFWIYAGAGASFLQMLPIILMVYNARQALLAKQAGFWKDPAFLFLLGSLFWNIVGVGLLGLTIALPPVNRYTHGTYLTSAHAHLALFGLFGQAVLGTSLHIFNSTSPFPEGTKRLLRLSFWLINGGLALMAFFLSLAGLEQTLLVRVAGLDFAQVHLFLRPLLLGRVGGGILFALGGGILAVVVLSYVIIRKEDYVLAEKSNPPQS